MRFKPLHGFLIGTFLFAGLTACGEKKSNDRNLLPGQDTGCFDALGERVSRYFDGSIDDAEWQLTFDCVKDQVTFFRKYVRGSEPTGYSSSDITALVRKFLFVRKPVSNSFVGSIFEIKASVFGGSAVVITPGEIDEFLRLSEVIRKETSILLPYLRAKRKSPTRENFLALADHIEIFGSQLGDYFGKLDGSIDVRKETFLPFVREIIELHGGDPTTVDRYGDFVRNLKVIVAGGSPDVIEHAAWPNLIRRGGAFGGLLFAYRDMEDLDVNDLEKNIFQIELTHRVHALMNRIIRLHGNGIPLSLFDPVIDTVPLSGLNAEQRRAIKRVLRPGVARALQGGVVGRLTPSAVATIVELFETGMRRQIHLRRIYRTIGTAPSLDEFKTAAKKYGASGLTARERAEVDDLIRLAENYIGLFPENSGQMFFSKAIRETRTRNHMFRMNWSRVLLTHALKVYASGPASSSGAKIATTKDLAELIMDFQDVLVAWKMSGPSDDYLGMAEKRFREANLFMPNSNGDSYMDDAEGTYYLAFLFSSGAFSNRVLYGVTHNSRDWSACPIVGVDELHQPAMEAQCFRNAYFGHPEAFWTSFPGLQQAYANMGSDEKSAVAMSMEIAARTGGYNERAIGPFDIDAFAALPHYVEDVMERFDRNGNGVLDKDEILNHAYPIFKETLSKATDGTKSNFVLKGLLTYIIKYGKAPPSKIALLVWCAKMPVSKVTATRVSIYRVVALLSAPLAKEKSESDGGWPMDDSILFPTTQAAQ